jgi:hypothetical protein
MEITYMRIFNKDKTLSSVPKSFFLRHVDTFIASVVLSGSAIKIQLPPDENEEVYLVSKELFQSFVRSDEIKPFLLENQ